MQDGQPDLFDSIGSQPPNPPAIARSEPGSTPVADLTDAALIAAIPVAGPATCHALTQEAVRRRLAASVPALEALCRRFKGFGLRHRIPEQTASLQALAAIGGAEAMAAIRRIIVSDVVAGPGLREAVAAASALRCKLPEHTALSLLRHADPGIRALACRCAPDTASIADLLLSLHEDLNQTVAIAAAKALGRMGRPEARPWLVHLLRQDPDGELIEAITPIADDECAVLLGRIARGRPALYTAVLNALEAIETPRAETVLAALAPESTEPA
jgi:HEAT repeat protein